MANEDMTVNGENSLDLPGPTPLDVWRDPNKVGHEYIPSLMTAFGRQATQLEKIRDAGGLFAARDRAREMIEEELKGAKPEEALQVLSLYQDAEDANSLGSSELLRQMGFEMAGACEAHLSRTATRLGSKIDHGINAFTRLAQPKWGGLIR